MPGKKKTAAVPATSSAPAKKPAKVILSVKDATYLKNAHRFSDQHKYKKALKLVDGLLNRFPTHGETLALKGLIVTRQGKEEEGVELIKKGIQNDFMNHKVWHMYGNYYQHQFMYEDTIKCYLRALKFNKEDNFNIVNDIASMQVHCGLYEGFMESRRKMVIEKPNRPNFVGYAVGAHLNNNYEKAAYILSTCLKSHHETKPTYEESELKLYKARVLKESGDLNKALEYLNEIENDIKDQTGYKLMKADICISLNEYKQAESLYRELLDKNQENYDFFRGIYRSFGIKNVHDTSTFTEEEINQLLKFFNEFEEKYPRCNAAKRLPLDFTSGNEFSKRVDIYMKRFLTKGIPSLYHDFCSLYDNNDKVIIINNLLTQYLTCLRKNLSFDGVTILDDPSILFWCLYFAGNHYDRLNETDKALAVINEGIQHTCTSLDMYMLKAKVMRNAGDVYSAFHYMNMARVLDTQDRYLNTKCTRYALQASEYTAAEKIVSLFLKEGTDDVTKHMTEYQACWYELNKGQGLMKESKYTEALNEFLLISKHYDTFVKEQIDFHNWCLRKSTVRTYINMLNWRDSMNEHPTMRYACYGIVECILSLFEMEEMEKKKQLTAEQGLTDKQIKQRRKKQEQKLKKAEEKAAELLKEEGKEAKTSVNVDYNKEIIRHISILLSTSDSYIKSQVLGVHVFLHDNKIIRALKCLLKAIKIDNNDPTVYFALISFLNYWESNKNNDNMNIIVKEMVNNQLTKHKLNILSIEDTQRKYLNENNNSLKACYYISKAQEMYFHDKTNDTIALLTTKLTTLIDTSSLTDVAEAFKFYISLNGVNNDDVNNIKHIASKKFPYALVFMNEQNVDELKSKLDFRFNATLA